MPPRPERGPLLSTVCVIFERLRVRGRSRLAYGLLALLTATGCAPEPTRSASELRSTAPTAGAEEDHSELAATLDQLRQSGKAQEALAIVRRQLELSPTAALLHFHHGLLLRATGDFAAAEAAVSRALELEPAHYPSYRALGDLARHRGATAEAATAFERCVAGLPDHAGCRYGLSLSRIDLGELDAAAGHLAAAAEQLDRVDVWCELGQLERRRRRLEASIAAFSRALALDRVHLPTLLGMGQALVAAGRKAEGEALLERHRREAAVQDQLDALERAAAQPGAGVDVRLQLARLYRSRDDSDGAEAALREAVARSPTSPPAVLALANLLLHRGDAGAADRLVAGLLPRMAGDPAILFLQGTIDAARGDESAAQAHFEASLARGPWPPPVYLDAGKAWLDAGFPARAADAFARAIKGLPESAEAHLGLAESRRATGAAPEALKALRRSLELDASDGWAWLLLGVLETERGDHQKARRAFARGLEARQLDLLAADGAEQIRRDVQALEPPVAALGIFDRELEARHAA